MSLSAKIYSKTGKGSRALSSKSRQLSSNALKILSCIDSKTDTVKILAQLEKLSEAEFSTLVSQLETDGYIRLLSNSDWEFGDTSFDYRTGVVVDELSAEDFFAMATEPEPNAGAKAAEIEAVSAKPVSKEPSADELAEMEARLNAERQAQEEEEARAIAEKIAKREAERIVQEETQRKARQEAERQAREEEEQAKAEAFALVKAQESAKLEAERKAMEEEEARRQAEEAVRLRAEEAARQEKARQEEQRLAREEAERKARDETARLKAEADARARAEKAARQEAERIAREEAKRKEREEKVARRKAAAEARAQAEEAAKLEAARKAQEAAERKIREEEEARRQAEEAARLRAEEAARQEEQRLAREETERKEREEKTARAKAEAEARALAEEAARLEAERKAQEEAERQARKEEEARQKAEAAARAKAEKVARQEAGRIAKEEAKRKAQEEKEARRAVAAEARARAAEEARHQAELKAREKAERRAEKEALRGTGNPGKWLALLVKPLLIYLPLALVVLVGLLHFVNLAVLAEPIEKLASDTIGEPVNIRKMRVALFPSPRLTLSGISVGADEEIEVGSIQVSSAVSTLFDEVKTLESLQIEQLVVDSASLSRQMQWISKSARSADLKIGQIALKNISFSVPGLELTPFDGSIELLPSGGFSIIELNSTDQDLVLQFMPQAGNYRVTVKASNWQPAGTKLRFSKFNADGVADANQVRFSQVDGVLYGGSVKAVGVVEWSAQPIASGNFELEKIRLPLALSDMSSSASVDGTLSASASFLSKASEVGKLVEAAEITATFMVQNGKINGIDLASHMIASNSSDNSTRFDKLAGKLQLSQGGLYQYRQLVLDTTQFHARGSLDIQPNQDITGKVSAELSVPTRRIRSNLNLGGKVGAVRIY